VMASAAAMLRGYQLDPSQEIHALRMLRSTPPPPQTTPPPADTRSPQSSPM
jgi:hypothetical protein